MGRQFPRFLFSDPKNVKHSGPFIVHTIYPRFIARVTGYPTGYGQAISFQILERIDPYDPKKEDQVCDAMSDWLFAQVKSGEIHSNPRY